MSASITKTKCPAAGCGVMKAKRLFMCPAHWRLVPATMQREIWTYYRNKNWEEYFKVARKAIAHVNSVDRVAEPATGGIENLKLEI
jgi:hypothetical protein